MFEHTYYNLCIVLTYLFFLKSLKFLVDVVRDTKINREKNPSSRQNDFLQLMLDAAQKEHEENDQTNKTNSDIGKL